MTLICNGIFLLLPSLLSSHIQTKPCKSIATVLKVSEAVLRLELNFLPEQKLFVLMVLLEWSELMSHSFPSSSEKGESDRGEPLSFGRNGCRTKRGMRLRGLPFSEDFFSCAK